MVWLLFCGAQAAGPLIPSSPIKCSLHGLTAHPAPGGTRFGAAPTLTQTPGRRTDEPARVEEVKEVKEVEEVEEVRMLP